MIVLSLLYFVFFITLASVLSEAKGGFYKDVKFWLSLGALLILTGVLTNNYV